MTNTAIDNQATVIANYEAFGRGDVAAILDTLAEEVRWDADWTGNAVQVEGGPTYMRPRVGRLGVAEFFAAAAELTLNDFQVLSVFGSGSEVGVKVLADFTVPSGGRYVDDEIHLWTFDERGQVVSLRHYTDTAKHLAAWAGADTRS